MWDTKKFQEKAISSMLLPLCWSAGRVSRLISVPSSTLRRWKHHYDLFGEVPAATRARNHRYKSGYRGEMGEENVGMLKEIAKEKPWLYLDEFQEELQRRCGRKFSCPTIHRTLVKRCNWSLTLAFETAAQQNQIERAKHLAQLRDITADPRCFIFIDETAKDRKASRRSRLWHPRNTRNNRPSLFANMKEYRYSMLGAVDIEGFVKSAC